MDRAVIVWLLYDAITHFVLVCRQAKKENILVVKIPVSSHVGGSGRLGRGGEGGGVSG